MSAFLISSKDTFTDDLQDAHKEELGQSPLQAFLSGLRQGKDNDHSWDEEKTWSDMNLYEMNSLAASKPSNTVLFREIRKLSQSIFTLQKRTARFQSSKLIEARFRQTMLSRMDELDQRSNEILDKLQSLEQSSSKLDTEKLPVSPTKEQLHLVDTVIPDIQKILNYRGIQPHFVHPFNIYLIDDASIANRFVDTIMLEYAKRDLPIRIIGFDTETAPRDTGKFTPSIVQVAFAENLVVIFQVYIAG